MMTSSTDLETVGVEAEVLEESDAPSYGELTEGYISQFRQPGAYATQKHQITGRKLVMYYDIIPFFSLHYVRNRISKII